MMLSTAPHSLENTEELVTKWVVLCFRGILVTASIMQESTMVSTKRELQESRMASTGREQEEEIRHHPSINTEPRTLDEFKMERAMVTAQKIYAEHPAEDFTKDAVDTATKENAPADDAGDGNSLQTHPDDGAHSYFMSTKGPPPPAAT